MDRIARGKDLALHRANARHAINAGHIGKQGFQLKPRHRDIAADRKPATVVGDHLTARHPVKHVQLAQAYDRAGIIDGDPDARAPKHHVAKINALCGKGNIPVDDAKPRSVNRRLGPTTARRRITAPASAALQRRKGHRTAGDPRIGRAGAARPSTHPPRH